MPNVVFFSFAEEDRDQVLMIKGRAMNSQYSSLNFLVHDLLARWDTNDPAVIRQAISKEMKGTSRTIVFVGDSTYKSFWVPQEVAITLENSKPVYAIRLNNTLGITPKCLTDNYIIPYQWSEANLQKIATV
jgi:hypothetical protein